jgi:hypothetical protein
MNQQSTTLLFVSNRCGHSRQFVQELRQLGATNSVHQINIDSTPRERIPSAVRSVPTIIINTASQQLVLVGDQAFAWLHAQKQQHPQHTTTTTTTTQVGNGGGMNPAVSYHRAGPSSVPTAGAGGAGGGGAAASNGEPQAWHSTEMGPSFSDTYSFIDNSFTEGGNGGRSSGSGSGTSGGSTIPKTFAYLSASPMDVQQPPQPPVYSAQNTQQQQMAFQRQAMPSGQGSFTPNATMAPPTQNNTGGGGGLQMGAVNGFAGGAGGFGGIGGFGGGGGGGGGNGPATDELTKRLEKLRMSRENDVPNAIPRVG